MASPGAIRAGAASIDITPTGDIQLAGAVGLYRPAKFVLDPLYARALVVEGGEERILLISLDLTIVTKEHADRIRRSVESQTGIPFEAVMVHATQTHSAPSLGHFLIGEEFGPVPDEFDWIRGGDRRYWAYAEERILKCVEEAERALSPVQVAAGSGVEGRHAFNRRAVTRDGTVVMPGRRWEDPLGPTYIRYLEGPIDPEVGVVCFRDSSLNMRSLLVNYTCHPVHVFPKPVVSADWPGALADEVKRSLGDSCVPIILNGACGNINPWPPFDPDYADDHRLMGRALSKVVLRVMETLEFAEEAAVDYATKRIKIPLREVEGERLKWAEEKLRSQPSPAWRDERRDSVDPEWVIAAGLLGLHRLRERQPYHEYEIQAFRIGDVAIVGLPGEPFVEGGLRIKLGSPTYPTYVVHCVNQYVGYIPTSDAFKRGGHEAATSPWSRLVPEALDMIVDAALDVLRHLF